MSRKITYEDIFDLYLNLCPIIKRKLYTIKDIQDWLNELNLNPFLKKYPELFLFLEFLYHNNLVVPFFCVRFPMDYGGFRGVLNDHPWKYYYKKGWISFLDKKEFVGKEWEDSRKKQIPQGDIRYQIHNPKYIYHPIQIIQILTFLVYLKKNCSNLLQYKDFCEFYWNNRVKFKDYVSERFYKRLQERNQCLSEYISEEIKKRYKAPVYTKNNINKINYYIDILLADGLNRFKWLTDSKLKLLIKLEKVSHFPIFSPSFTKPILLFIDDNCHVIKDWDEVDIWFNSFEANRTSYLNIEEKSELKSLIKSLEWKIENFEGLQEWGDLIGIMKEKAKHQLKGFNSYYVNILELLKSIKHTEWYLRTENLEDSNDKPDSYSLKTNDAIQYYQQILYKYGLIPSDVFIIFVEGPTEKTIIYEWLKHRSPIDNINVKIMGSISEIRKSVKFTFEKFKDRQYFILLDYDNKEAKKKNQDQLRKFTDEKHYYFFSPDFITENFEINDILIAYKNWLTEEHIDILEEDLNDLKSKLETGKRNNERFEDILKEFTHKIDSFPSFQKTNFAVYLSKIVIDKVIKERSKTDRVFPFETILNENFFKQIYLYIDPIYKKYFYEEKN